MSGAEVQAAGIEYVRDAAGKTLAMVVRGDFDDYVSSPPFLDSEEERAGLAAGYAGTDPETERRTKAHITADESAFQITRLNRPPRAVTKPHYHHVATQRPANATRHKIMFCRSGRMRANVYATDGTKVAAVELAPGDFILTYEGHGYEFLSEGTRALEIMEGRCCPMRASHEWTCKETSMTPEERRQFVRDHRTCVWGYERQAGPPSMSVVYYVMDGDDIMISTMKARGKAKALERNGQVSLCVLDEQWPMTYLVVYGEGKIIDDEGEAFAMMQRLTELMSGAPPKEEELPKILQMCRDEHRVVARITPVATFETPPRHIEADTDISTVTHGLGNTIAWNA